MSDQLYQATEPATAFRCRQARQAGHLVRSTEVNTVMVLLAGLVMLTTLSPALLVSLKAFIVEMLSFAPKGSAEPVSVDRPLLLLRLAAWRFLICAAPACLTITAAVLLSGLLQSGFFFSTEPLAIKFERLSLSNGFKRVFSARSASMLAFHLLKLCIVALITFLTVRAFLPDLVRLSSVPQEFLLAAAGQLVLALGLRLIIALAVLAGLDYLLVRYFVRRDLRMSPQDIRQEQRDLRGSPLTQHRRSGLAKSSPASLSSAILQANLVLIDAQNQNDSTGPRLAIVLQCRVISSRNTSAGPVKLLARGSAALARQINMLASQRGLPIFNCPDLTRALARAVPLNHYVPLRLYPELTDLLVKMSGSTDSRNALAASIGRRNKRSLVCDLAT